MSAAALVLGLGLSVALVQGELHRGWRLLLIIPFFFAAIGAFQGLYRTCPVHARQKTRVNELGEDEVVANPEEVQASKRLGARVFLSAMMSACTATGLVFFLP